MCGCPSGGEKLRGEEAVQAGGGGGTAWGKSARRGQAWNVRSSVSDISAVESRAAGKI